MNHSLNKSLLCLIIMAALPACLEASREAEAHEAASSALAEAAGGHDQDQPRRVRQDFTPNGEELGLEQGPAPVTLATTATACLQLNVNASTFFINATLNVTQYPYAITGGSISGSICDSPNWVLTGGRIGDSITINGSHTGTPGACGASTITIEGPFGPPAGYTGMYGFNGSNNSFSHRTLFLGYNRSCP